MWKIPPQYLGFANKYLADFDFQNCKEVLLKEAHETINGLGSLTEKRAISVRVRQGMREMGKWKIGGILRLATSLDLGRQLGGGMHENIKERRAKERSLEFTVTRDAATHKIVE
ncbi:hypothetical protein V6N13_036767 [Hibiscus sabdariffa]